MKKFELDVHYISEGELPKKDDIYLVWYKYGGMDTCCFATDVTRVYGYLGPDEDPSHAGFYEEKYDHWHEYDGNDECTDEILAWADISSLEVLE